MNRINWNFDICHIHILWSHEVITILLDERGDIKEWLEQVVLSIEIKEREVEKKINF